MFLIVGKVYGLVFGKDDVELLVVVKMLKENSLIEIKEDFFKEVVLMFLFYYENIVELLVVFIEEEFYGMIFEFMEFGDFN